MPRTRVRVVAPRRVAGGLHAGRVRHQPRDPKALRPRPMGPIRLVRVAFPLVLGPAAASCGHPGGAAGRVRSRRRESRRTRRLRRHDRRGPTSPGRARPSSPTTATAPKRSKPTSTTPASPCCAPPPEPRPHVPAPDSCGPCARSPNRSTRPSKAHSPSNATKHAPKPASPRASAPASSPSPPPSGTTRPTDTPDQHAHSPHTTTKTLELII